MRRTAWSFAVVSVLLGGACSSNSRDQADGITTDPGTVGEVDSSTANPGINTDGSAPGTASDSASPNPGSPDAAAPGPGDQVIEYLTCKPEELNPIVDCLTVTCPMQADPIALATCLADDCAKLVDKVSPKCRDCVAAGIAQDTAALVQDCLDTGKILGDAGVGMLPF